MNAHQGNIIVEVDETLLAAGLPTYSKLMQHIELCNLMLANSVPLDTGNAAHIAQHQQALQDGTELV